MVRLRCGLLAIGLGLSSAAAAQPPASISVFQSPPAQCDRPTELPPLVPVPGAPQTQPKRSTGPVGEYDHSQFYLPERAPETRRGADRCGPAGRFWFAASLELGQTQGADVPVLVRLGTGDGPVLYGDERATAPTRAGLGINLGAWLDAAQTRGVDASFLALERGGTESLIGPGTPLLLSTASGTPYPLSDQTAGLVGAYQAGLNTRFTSADVNYRRNLICGPDVRLDALAGYRYGHVGDDFTIYGKRLGPGGGIVRFRDDVTAANHFHGGQVGLAGEYRRGEWFAAASGKVAFGSVFTDTDSEGKFRVDGTVVPAGFYSRPGIDGPRDLTRFAVMPAAAVSLGRQIGAHGRVSVGYQFQYLSDLTRASDVIDPAPPVTASDPFQVNPADSSRRDARTSDFWVQTVSLGLEWRY